MSEQSEIFHSVFFAKEKNQPGRWLSEAAAHRVSDSISKGTLWVWMRQGSNGFGLWWGCDVMALQAGGGRGDRSDQMWPTKTVLDVQCELKCSARWWLL